MNQSIDELKDYVIAHYIGLSTMNQSIDELKDYVIAHYIGLSTNLIHDFAYEK